jgi:hypothetical protein
VTHIVSHERRPICMGDTHIIRQNFAENAHFAQKFANILPKAQNRL